MVAVANVDPFIVPIPPKLLADPELRDYFNYLNRFLHDLWVRTGGGTDLINESFVNYLIEYQPTTQTAISGGAVIQYNSDTTTIYRFIPDPYDYDTDAFYNSFNGSSVTGLIATRK